MAGMAGAMRAHCASHTHRQPIRTASSIVKHGRREAGRCHGTTPHAHHACISAASCMHAFLPLMQTASPSTAAHDTRLAGVMARHQHSAEG